MAAAQEDPNRKLPELVYTMFVQLSKPIPDVYEASMVKLQVRMKPDKSSTELSLPSGGFQKVTRTKGDTSQLTVLIDLQVCPLPPSPAISAISPRACI